METCLFPAARGAEARAAAQKFSEVLLENLSLETYLACSVKPPIHAFNEPVYTRNNYPPRRVIRQTNNSSRCKFEDES